MLRSLQLSSGWQLSPDSLGSHCILCTVTSAGLVPVMHLLCSPLPILGEAPFEFTVIRIEGSLHSGP